MPFIKGKILRLKMETRINISNDASICTIDIEGVIGVPEESQFSHSSHSIATYERFRDEVAKLSQIEAAEVVVNIRSTGGDVNDALLIYESLVAIDAKITTRCYGYTASAATIIAQAASEGCRQISSSALYLVHQSSSAVEGNIVDLTERIDLLKKTDARIAELYASRSGREVAQFESLMAENGGRGRWLSPQEAVECGLADEIIGAEYTAKAASIVDMVKAWFSPNRCEKQPLPLDINILHKPDSGILTSVIAIKEGQKVAKSTGVNPSEDPLLDGASVGRNAMAYAEDLYKLKSSRM